jgi:hypothetical protein
MKADKIVGPEINYSLSMLCQIVMRNQIGYIFAGLISTGQKVDNW